MDNFFFDCVSSFTEAIAAPVTRWHEDNLKADLMRDAMKYQHEENMKRMEMVESAIKAGLISRDAAPYYLLGGK